MLAHLLAARESPLDTCGSAPTARATASVSCTIVSTSRRLGSYRQMPAIVSRLNALSGLNETLPISLTHTSFRSPVVSMGHFSPPAIMAWLKRWQRSDRVPFGSPIVKRVPSRWRTTPGASSSVPAYTTHPIARSGQITRLTAPSGSTRIVGRRRAGREVAPGREHADPVALDCVEVRAARDEMEISSATGERWASGNLHNRCNGHADRPYRDAAHWAKAHP